ncbi:MAG: hypothetical protein QF568_00825 [Flavobacteriales bacterium]|jgi:glycosyltransferase involved in cell wall biosynthesis|nr:hypothetical protein [Flavobacteriales bacterium]
MARKIMILIKDKKLAARTAKKGRKHILKNFSIESVAEKLYKAFIE